MTMTDNKNSSGSTLFRSSSLLTGEWLDEHSKEFIDQWTTAGLSKYVDLPLICVLGDTSSGKSSVLSNLIGLELPSGSTLTTKCPVLIQLKHRKSTVDGDDEATVDIQWYNTTTKNRHYQTTTNNQPSRQRKRSIEKQIEEKKTGDINHHHVDEMKDDRVTATEEESTTTIPMISSASPPPKWIPRKVTSELQTQVPKLLKEAQDLILNYRSDALISPDVICLSITSSNTERELTLIDLPGLVAYQHTSDSSLLSQVEQVVLHYVNNPRSILVPIVAAPTNIHNSKVLQWCKTVDPTTLRTIPVLTKPDLIDPGSESDTLSLLQETQFRHGFFMVKNRGQALLDSGASIEVGLQEEAAFFENTSPWNSIEDFHRLGIPSLRNTLASVLLQVMKDSLPDILDEIGEQFHEMDMAIESWGNMHLTRGDQRKFYHSLTQKLVSNVSASLSGKGPRGRKGSTKSPAGAARLHAACADFLKEIKNGSLATISTLVEGAPVLVSNTNNADDVRGEIVHIDNEIGFVCVDYVEEKDHTTDILFDAIGYSTEQVDFEKDEVWSDGSRVFIGRENGYFDSLRKLPLNNVRTDPAWLVDKIAEFRTDDLACFINVEMFRNVVGEFVQDDWAPPCLDLVKTLETIMMDSLNEALKDSFQQEVTRYPLLKTMMEERCNNVCLGLLDNARRDVKAHLEIEENHPYTQDEVLLQALSENRFQNLRRDLELQLRLTQEGVVFDTQAIKTILDSVFNKHKRLHWMAEHMEMVLSSYGKVATQRVLDRTPQICWQTCRKLPDALQEELGGITDDILEKCLWESPESKEKYQEMVTTLKDLQEAMEVVKRIQ